MMPSVCERRNRLEEELWNKIREYAIGGSGYFSKETTKNIYSQGIDNYYLAMNLLQKAILRVSFIYHPPWEKEKLSIIYKGEEFDATNGIKKLIIETLKTLNLGTGKSKVDDVYSKVMTYTEISKDKLDILRYYVVTNNHFVFDSYRSEMLGMTYKNLYFFYDEFREYLEYNDKISKAIIELQKFIQEGDISEDTDISGYMEFMEAWEELISLLPFKFRIPVNYDPEAKAPRWDQFLSEVLDEKYHTALKRFLGYTLYPRVLSKYPSIAVFVGEGANGKSVFLHIIEAIFGKDNVSHLTLQELDERFTKANLIDKLLNIAGDLPREGLRNTGILKALTGGDPIYIEEKYKRGYFDYIPAKHIFSTNELPPTYDKTTGFYRRWLIFIFPNVFMGENADPFLEEKLLQELPGIFNWILEGYREFMDTEDLGYPHTLEEVIEMYESSSDSLVRFINEECEKAPGEKIPFSEFYRLYKAYCDEHNLSPKGVPTVGRELLSKATYVERKRSKDTRYLLNIRVKYRPPTERKNHLLQEDTSNIEKWGENICIEFIKNYEKQKLRYPIGTRAEVQSDFAEELIKNGFAVYCDRTPKGAKIRVLNDKDIQLADGSYVIVNAEKKIYKVFMQISELIVWSKKGFIEILEVIY